MDFMIRLSAACVIALTALAQSAGAQACKGARASSAGYCFVSDLATALTVAHIAALATPDTTAPNVMSVFADLLATSAKRRNGIGSAVVILAPHASSADSAVQASATTVINALAGLYGSSLAADSLLRAVLDQKAGSPSQQVQGLADLKTRLEAGAMLLILSTVSATHVLLEQNPRDAAHMRLNIGPSERDALKEQLRIGFGRLPPVGAPDTGPTTDFSRAAQVIDRFLRDKWPTRP